MPLPHGPNLIGLPTDFLASADYAAAPCELHISGVREMNAPLFEMLALANDIDEASEALAKYMTAMFGLEAQQLREEARGMGPPFRHSFVRLLIGWGLDSSSRDAAVLKGWVESRFGLAPAHHGAKITSFSDPAWATYVEHKMGSGFHANSIFAQLDLVYEYVQWALATLVRPGETHLRLYRGADRVEDQVVRRLNVRQPVLRLNSLSSFTTDRAVADSFGSVVVSVEAPLTKILFASALMSFFAFRAEREVLLIGGDYPATVERPLP
ncbi:NAD+--dinitrogen-reductase ADP-D-ribosyltransferase [Roseiarcus fermentans]|uniref:NAD+--dinitrogen-reductase ADP-D-ribosyltransferase n=1 Tax=Roseiarcus fermentans TaxID=1473586 RepID=A0A366ERL6_9HYPH|nr:NAD(+)--dinitrogen-reductase ADP-D-ribosyltransferase [Roseiarcus fermentans]RBP04139.1 NAD+--dinitrogen-reductase ADP-D-ribosyltransferase [Roseiarcus fermentans]